MRTALILLWWVSWLGAEDDRFAWANADLQAVKDGMMLAVDAIQLASDGLLHSRVSLPVVADKGWVYPKWVPGTHAPSGEVAHFGGIRVRDTLGGVVPWERDPLDPWRMVVKPTTALTRAQLDLTYIANLESDLSEGVDVLAGDHHAVINWNCALWYPEGTMPSTLPCTVAIRLPPGWQAACSLPTVRSDGNIIHFATMPLSEVIDRPLIAGKVLERFVVRPAATGPEVLLHVVNEQPDQHFTAPDYLAALRRMPGEAEAIFGGSWFSRYDLMMILSERPLGLEHATCSLNGALLDDFANQKSWAAYLVPHEFVHSWIGKHRRPVDMLRSDMQQVPNFDGLWVYEGLTELMGRILAVRCGMRSEAGFRSDLASAISSSRTTTGRQWRSLRDTCRCNWQIRSPAQHHTMLRRSQDYYEEGALVWLVIHRRLMAASGGRHGVDELCRRFFGPAAKHRQGFSEAELITALSAIGKDDWAGLITRWIDGTGDLDVAAILDGSGWRHGRMQVRADDVDAMAQVQPHEVEAALGLGMNGGWVTHIDPLGPAAKAGIRKGDYIFSANQRELKNDPQVLLTAVVESPPPATMALYVHRKEVWSTIAVTLREPLHITTLIRQPNEPDIFAPWLAPRVTITVPIPVTP